MRQESYVSSAPSSCSGFGNCSGLLALKPLGFFYTGNRVGVGVSAPLSLEIELDKQNLHLVQTTCMASLTNSVSRRQEWGWYTHHTPPSVSLPHLPQLAIQSAGMCTHSVFILCHNIHRCYEDLIVSKNRHSSFVEVKTKVSLNCNSKRNDVASICLWTRLSIKIGNLQGLERWLGVKDHWLLFQRS